MSDPDARDLVRPDDLDMTADEVRRRWPAAVVYVGLDGSPCWRRSDLEDSVEGGR